MALQRGQSAAQLAKLRIRHECSAELIIEKNKRISNEQRDRISNTPFKWLLELKYFQVNGPLLLELVNRWDSKRRGFMVNDRVVRFTPHDIAFFLGLRIKGSIIEVQRQYGFSLTHEIIYKQYERYHVKADEIVSIMSTYQSPNGLDDFCRLYITLLFSVFLFTLSTRSLHLSFLSLLDDLNGLDNYAWGMAVYDFLVVGLNRATIAVKQRTNSSQLHLTGCTLVLQIWALEHFTLYSDLCVCRSLLRFPRICCWGGKRLTSKKLQQLFSTVQEVSDFIVARDEELNFEVVKEAIGWLRDFLNDHVNDMHKTVVVDHQELSSTDWMQMYSEEKAKVDGLREVVKALNSLVKELRGQGC